LIEKAEAREKDRLKEEARKLRKLETAFKNMLGDAEPPVTETAKWDEVGETRAVMVCCETRYPNSNFVTALEEREA